MMRTGSKEVAFRSVGIQSNGFYRTVDASEMRITGFLTLGAPNGTPA
jgi:hypothetical protein